MACFHPMQAWRTPAGRVSTSKEQPDSTAMRLPCGGCLGCRQARAREWALRCTLELQEHQSAVFTTLTYDDAHLPQSEYGPPSLNKPDLQKWLKRLRQCAKRTRRRPARSGPPADGALRFFASGEYGEANYRPHYHAIVYGLNEQHRNLIEDTWGQGITHTINVTPAAIAYVAGYTSKKIGYRLDFKERQIVDQETGELLYEWTPPFVQMSRNPGIGANAKRHRQSWRSFAVLNAQKLPVPRYLHAAWEETATAEEQELLSFEKAARSLLRDTSKKTLAAAEQIAMKQQTMQALRRNL